MNTRTFKRTAFGAAALAVGLTFPMHAANIVLIDFGRTDNTTADTLTTFFNNSASTDVMDLVFSDGSNSGIDLAVNNTNSTEVAGSGADYNSTYPALVASQPESALEDSVFVNANRTVTLTFSDLDANLTYDILLYGARGNNGSGLTTYSVFDGTLPVETASFAALNNAANVANFVGLTPDGNNEITITVATADRGAINFGQITVVPEPGSLALLAAGSLLITRRRRG